MSEREDRRFAERARERLERSAQELDADTGARLRAARLRALDAAPQRSRWLYGVPIGALATASAALLAVYLSRETPALGPGATLEDFELLSDAEPLELYEQLEFLEWLDAHEQKG
jgi:hypothetical protein